MFISSTYYSDAIWIGSDSRRKQNIHSIQNALDIIAQMEPVQFDLIPDALHPDQPEGKTQQMQALGANNLGFVAQDLQQIFPSLVHYSEADDYYAVNYIAIIPLLVKAMQEQKVVVDDQQEQIEALQALVAQLMESQNQ